MKFYLLILFFLLAPEAISATFLVDSPNDTNDLTPGDGICADVFGQCTLRAAIEETNNLPGADIVYLQRGVSYQNGFSSQLITDSLTLSIENPFTPITSALQLPQIHGNNNRVFKVENATEVTFFGLLITDGDVTQNSLGDQYGGGVSVDDVTTFNLLNSIVYDNRALTGAGIEFRNVGNVLISLSDISYNENVESPSHGIAIKHGGVNAGEIKIQHSSIHHNAVINTSFNGCSFAIEKGFQTGDMYVFNTLISDNGDVANPMNCVNGIFAGSWNIYQISDLYLVNSTIINNSGTGLDFNDYSAVITGDLFVRNAILANNHFKDCDILQGIINFGDANGGHNITSDSSCNLPAVSGNMQNTNPMLSDAKSIFPYATFLFIYYEPMVTSPAIDNGSPLPVHMGNPNACQQYDQLLRVRPIDGNGNGSAVCDIGAVEYTDLIFENGFE